MKAFLCGLLLLMLLTLLTPASAAPAKLSTGPPPQKDPHSPLRDHNLVGPRAYSYDPPPAPAERLPNHLELAGPPPAPLLPDRAHEKRALFPPSKRTSIVKTSTTTTSTTTTTTPLPPPSGLYGAPSNSDSDASSLNSNFVSILLLLDFDLEVPEVVEVSPTPATLPTPKGFSPPPPDKSEQPFMPYRIAWRVRGPTAAHHFSHTETSGGEDVRGQYRVLLPDGRMQIVTFRAGPSSGYNAAVTYTKADA